MKNSWSVLKNKFFQGKDFVLENLDLNKRCTDETEDYKEKKCSWLINTVSQKIGFTVYDVHREHPQAEELIISYK